MKPFTQPIYVFDIYLKIEVALLVIDRCLVLAIIGGYFLLYSLRML
ncbi:hypothetical protein I600_2179 [Maribacter dokdonensis DSW-8]|nr:hypothetical protein I600_2179 [Maribacter dokdonensis DSW-8]